MVEGATPLGSNCARFLRGMGSLLMGLGIGGSLISCGGESTSQLEPVELAFLIPTNFSGNDAFTAGTTTGFVEFDLQRFRDSALITEPLNVLVFPQGRSADQSELTDTLGNPLFVERAVVLLGNGLDRNNDGVADPPPTSAPAPIEPMVPAQPPQGWEPSRTLAYTPNQTTVPEMEPIPRFGFYASSITAFEAQIGFNVQDVLGQVVPAEVNVNFPAGPTQPVTISIVNATASEQNPIVIAVCNQLRATVYVGLRSGSTTTLSVPQVSPEPDTPLNVATTYITEAYQFDSVGALLQVSSNPDNPGSLSVPLLDSSGTTDGTAELSLVSSSDGDQLTCAGDQLLALPGLLETFF